MKLLNLLILALPQHLYLTFNGDCLKQNKFYYTPDNITNIYTVYDLTSTTNYNPDFTLENYLFGSVKITKNTDVNKYKYSGYGIGFDGKGVFTHPTGSFGNNAIIFGVDMSSSVHIDDKKKRHFNSWKGFSTRIRRAFINCRKNVFSQF